MFKGDHMLAEEYEIPDSELSDKLTQMIMTLFEHWHLTYAEQSHLLGLSDRTNSTISRYKKGMAHIRFGRDSYDRVRYLLSIHKILRTLFKHNPDLAYKWMKSNNTYFENKTPVEVITADGFLGVVKVHNYLENYRSL